MCQMSNLRRPCKAIFAAKKMKRKKIIFSSSGGTPAMRLLTFLIDHFGNEDIEHIAAQIAAKCRNCILGITVSFEDNIPVFHGSTAMSIAINETTLELTGENLKVENGIVSIS